MPAAFSSLEGPLGLCGGATDNNSQKPLTLGGIVGYPLMKVKLTILNIDYREGESDEIAVQAAASKAVREALNQADVVLLEPIMKLEVVTPDEFMGNIQSDLNSRRAIIVNTEIRGHLQAVESQAPLSEMFGYSSQVRSLSQGRASYTMQFAHYAEVPRQVADEVKAKFA